MIGCNSAPVLPVCCTEEGLHSSQLSKVTAMKFSRCLKINELFTKVVKKLKKFTKVNL